MQPLLELSNITLKFGGLTALSGVNLDIPAHKISGIIGPNGAGKSTLFNLVTGIYKPNQGKIIFNEQQLQSLKTSEIARLGIARTFQNIRLLPHLSVMDNLYVVTAIERKGTFWSSLLNLKEAKRLNDEIQHRAESLLKLVGLTHVKNHFPGALPYGSQRKLEIARALMTKPKLLLLDEPAAGMNPVEKEALGEILLEVLKSNITILVIEHDMKFIMNLCQQISVLNQGEICAKGTPKEIQNNKHVIEIYLGKGG